MPLSTTVPGLVLPVRPSLLLASEGSGNSLVPWDLDTTTYVTCAMQCGRLQVCECVQASDSGGCSALQKQTCCWADWVLPLADVLFRFSDNQS
jgi:hypothetical protein